jgi:DNA polymerase V
MSPVTSAKNTILLLLYPIQDRVIQIPLFLSKVPAGDPFHCSEELDNQIDLNEYCIKNPVATFLVKVDGNSLKKEGIHHGDILIVDKSIDASSGKMVIAVINGEFKVKRLSYLSGDLCFLSDDGKTSIPIYKDDMEGEIFIWGVVTYCIHSL